MAYPRAVQWLCWLALLGACDSLGDDDAPAGTTEDGGAGRNGGGLSGNGAGDSGLPDDAKLPLAGDRIDTSGGAWRIVEAPASGESLVRTPDGWLALVSRSNNSGKVTLSADNSLYRSADGVVWDAIPLEASGLLTLNALAYGNGRYVMVGRHDGMPVLWTSSDGERWKETPQEMDSSMAWGGVRFVGGRFFATGFRVLGVSEDGERWQRMEIGVFQVFGIAHGNGRFMITGSGGVITSADGLSWQNHPVDCSLPDVCVTDPSGGVHPTLTSPVYFAEGAFFAGRLSSKDGTAWKIASEHPVTGHSSGQFLSLQQYELFAWPAGQSPQPVPLVRPAKAAVTAEGREFNAIGRFARGAPLPARVEVGFDDGLSCKDAACVLVAGHLLLAPPAGTPPLADRVPRDATGEPLLSEECPVSAMIRCADYEAREGCTCNQDAPYAPSSCDDVGQFSCEGEFTPRPEEWDVPEVGRAGCSCDGVDPNQPATFGRTCMEGDFTCQRPLECLAIAPSEPNAGFPQPTLFKCSQRCDVDSDCPSWEATGVCAGSVQLKCAQGSCQPRSCE